MRKCFGYGKGLARRERERTILFDSFQNIFGSVRPSQDSARGGGGDGSEEESMSLIFRQQQQRSGSEMEVRGKGVGRGREVQ